MIHTKFNLVSAIKKRIAFKFMFIVLYLMISINVIALGQKSKRPGTCKIALQDSTIINGGEWHDPYETNQAEDPGRPASIFSASDCELASVSLPGCEMYESFSDWELKKSIEDICIYSQWIKMDADHKRRRLLGDMTVDAPVSSVVALIKNETRAENWIYGIKNYYHLDIAEENCWYSYAEFRFPWPFPNYDLILRNCLTSEPQKRATIIEIQNVTDLVPEKEGIKRLQHFRGTWKLTPLPDGRTSIEFIIFTKMNSNTPTWISDPIVMSGMMNTMKKMRRIVSNSGSISYEFKSMTKY